jgi:hypothetical protein
LLIVETCFLQASTPKAVLLALLTRVSFRQYRNLQVRQMDLCFIGRLSAHLPAAVICRDSTCATPPCHTQASKLLAMSHDYLLLDNEMAAAASGSSGGRRKRPAGSSKAKQQRQPHVAAAASAECGTHSGWSSGGWEEEGDSAYSRHRSRKAGKDGAAAETLLSRVLNKPKKRCAVVMPAAAF